MRNEISSKATELSDFQLEFGKVERIPPATLLNTIEGIQTFANIAPAKGGNSA
jgi:hypothetical protein